VIDLFGGIKRGQEQAAANLEASGFNLGDARAAVTQSIVMHYVSARFAQEAAALTRKTVASREQTLSLVRAKRRAGTASEFEIVQTEADLFTAKADLQGYLSNFESSVFAMTTVLDADPAPTLLKMQRGAPQASPRGTSLLGKPADLLRNIPSVRVAESTYAAAVAGLGVQEAKLLPSLTLSGKLTVNDPKSWSFGPAISLPVFNQPALKANRDAQIAVVEEAMLNWRAAVRAAVGDVETQSHSLLRSNRQVSLLRLAIGSSEKALALNKANFEAGRSSLIELLDAERTTSARRLALASEVQSATIEWANLQVALGRGWKIKQ
jgi:multidrug efflux system outer membrane protein